MSIHSNLWLLIGTRLSQGCIAGAGALLLGTAQAAAPLTGNITFSDTQPASITHTLKQQLARLRDFTFNSLTPADESRQAEWNDATDPGLQFNVESQLFKPTRRQAHANTLERLLKQQAGFQIGRNAQFQCDFNRYRTANDQREVRVKLGINVGFR